LQAVDAGHIETTPLDAHGQQENVAGNLRAIGQLEEAVRAFGANADSFLRSENFNAEAPRLGNGTPGQIVSTQSGRKPR